MRKIAGLVSGVALASASAQAAVVLPSGRSFDGAFPTIAYDGVGDGINGSLPGTTVAGSWFRNGQVHVFIYTGDQPESYGWFTMSVPSAVIPKGLRPICAATAAWTNPDYAFGYAIPEWPFVFVQQHAYDIAQGTVTFTWQVMGHLDPRAGYSINVICPPK